MRDTGQPWVMVPQYLLNKGLQAYRPTLLAPAQGLRLTSLLKMPLMLSLCASPEGGRAHDPCTHTSQHWHARTQAAGQERRLLSALLA